ncbi:hypothetical protein [Pararobbsia silviterrae]|uniref:Cupin n=1 Tax=Pararobbsia silviterrae TaxID=1792498 RepID=A0A494Y1I8_9BURK|nr:hypothetical protein [Pararobbsia silviterrae]RKP56632.1 hypothetical protein D7S86_09760 [Pararobbsia silviterrae]
MTHPTDTGVRETAVYDLANGTVARGQNFFVQWLEGAGTPFVAKSAHEMMVLLPDAGEGATLRLDDGHEHVIRGRSVVIVPAGRVTLDVAPAGRAVLIASSRPDLGDGAALNDADYASPDARIIGSEAGYRRADGVDTLRVIDIDAITPPADKPRLKMLQTDTLSINWVEYHDARDRSKLSPHSHTNFEQGSLAIDGHFVHHLRVQWGPDANQWREDAHLAAGPASMIAIPVQLIHTTEGVGAGRHLLIDVFSPPRKDFIEKGWVSNAADYTVG